MNALAFMIREDLAGRHEDGIAERLGEILSGITDDRRLVDRRRVVASDLQRLADDERRSLEINPDEPRCDRPETMS